MHLGGALIPAGPVEIIAGGGLCEDDLECTLSLSVADAQVASLPESVEDLAPQQTRSPVWRRSSAADCAQVLADSIVIR